jgi:hypothetical protein
MKKTAFGCTLFLGSSLMVVMALSRQVLSLPAASTRSQYSRQAGTTLARNYHPLVTIPTTRLAHTARHSRNLPFLALPSLFRLHSTTSENALPEIKIPRKFVAYPFEVRKQQTMDGRSIRAPPAHSWVLFLVQKSITEN